MPDRASALVPQWQAAERRLYPLAVTAPDVFERHVSLVRLVADELASASLEQLAALFEDRGEIVEEVALRERFEAEGLDQEAVLGAACALRYREAVAEARREEAMVRIRESRERGERWVVLHETISAGGREIPPYDRLEMHLPDGAGLLVFVELDPEMDGWLYGVETVQLDPVTGDRIGRGEPPSERTTFAEKEPWAAAVDELRVRHGGLPN